MNYMARLKKIDKLKTISLLLRISLALVFLYAAINAFQQPAAWIGFVPDIATKVATAKTILDILSVIQIGLALVLLSGRYLKYAALFAALMLAGILVTSPGAILITFRDIGLIGASLSLVVIDL